MSYIEFVQRTATVFILGAIFALVWLLRDILMLGFLSVVIALMLSLPMQYLQKQGVERRYAMPITVIGTVLVFFIFFLSLFPVFVTSIIQLANDLPSAIEDAVTAYSDWREEQDDGLVSFLPELDRNTSIDGDQIEEDFITADEIVEFVLPSIGQFGNFLAGLVANLVFIVIISLFILADPKAYVKGALMVVPQHNQQRAAEILTQLNLTLRSWMTALSLSITVTTIMVTIWLGVILGIPNALAIGLIAGMTTIIPNVGLLIPLIPITIFTLADDPTKLPFALIGYYIIQQIEGNFITPTFVKEQLSIPAGAVFLFQLIAASLFGFLGILLAVPLLAVIITLVRELYVYDMLGFRDREVNVKVENNRVEVIFTDTATSEA